jgi:hypothetical protein
MMRWYADNSELNGIWGSAIPDILIYGGICANNHAQNCLCEIIKNVKAGYNKDVDFPLKWNFRALEVYYQNIGKFDLYDRLLKSSKIWRKSIFRQIASVDFIIIMSIIHGYGRDRNIQLKTRQNLTRYVFSNALMRLGIHIKEIDSPKTELVLDWPPEGDKNLFDSEYRCAYFRGLASNNQEYFCGPLEEIGFSDSIFYSSTNECSLLQISDIIVGSVKDLVDYSLGRKRGRYGRNRVLEIKDRFRGAPSRVIGRGVSIAPTRNSLYDKLRNTIEGLYEIQS